MNAAVAAEMASWRQQMDQMQQTILNSNVNKGKKRNFKQPTFPLDTMAEFSDLEEKLQEKSYRRFMVSDSFPSLPLDLTTFICCWLAAWH
jgi:hypothetical protein